MVPKKRRVVITGLGVICPLGSSPEALWQALTSGRSAVDRLTLSPPDALPVSFGAEARQFRHDDIDSFGPLEKEQKKAIRKGLKVMCRECQMGVAAGQLALNHAALGAGAIAPERIGATFGSDYMITLPDDFCEGVRECLTADGRFDFSRWATNGLPKMSPLWLLKYLPNMPASHLAIYNDLQGPSNSITLREASSNAAVAEAYHTIVRGSAEVMLAGSTGTRLHPMKVVHAVQQEEIAEFNGEPATASRPFDRDRHGMVLGEGAGAIVLEDLDFAQGRGAKIYGEVVAGVSNSSLAPHMLARRGRAIENAIRAVLQAAGATPEEVGHLHAHGLSTRSCDAEEAAAIAAVFGGRQNAAPVVAAKSYFGNLGAGSGMVELIASLLAIEADRLFPVLNYRAPDPACPINVVRDDATPAGASVVNVNVSPQGQASAVLVRRFEG